MLGADAVEGVQVGGAVLPPRHGRVGVAVALRDNGPVPDREHPRAQRLDPSRELLHRLVVAFVERDNLARGEVKPSGKPDRAVPSAVDEDTVDVRAVRGVCEGQGATRPRERGGRFRTGEKVGRNSKCNAQRRRRGEKYKGERAVRASQRTTRIT